MGELADMLRNRVGRIQKVKGTDQGVPETVSHTPRVTAFTNHDTLDTQIEGRLAYALRNFLHILVIADEYAEVGCFRGIRT